jgi:hypothetical protein
MLQPESSRSLSSMSLDALAARPKRRSSCRFETEGFEPSQPNWSSVTCNSGLEVFRLAVLITPPQVPCIAVNQTSECYRLVAACRHTDPTDSHTSKPAIELKVGSDAWRRQLQLQ